MVPPSKNTLLMLTIKTHSHELGFHGEILKKKNIGLLWSLLPCDRDPLMGCFLDAYSLRCKPFSSVCHVGPIGTEWDEGCGHHASIYYLYGEGGLILCLVTQSEHD